MNNDLSPDQRKRLSYNYTKNSLQRINESLKNVDANYYSQDQLISMQFNSADQVGSSLRNNNNSKGNNTNKSGVSGYNSQKFSLEIVSEEKQEGGP